MAPAPQRLPGIERCGLVVQGTLGTGGENLPMLYRSGLREIALYWPAGNHTRNVVNQGGTLNRQMIP